jgi:hypothetical protein
LDWAALAAVAAAYDRHRQAQPAATVPSLGKFRANFSKARKNFCESFQSLEKSCRRLSNP